VPDASSGKPISITGAISEIFERCSDLIEKEIRLAAAEIAAGIAAKAAASAWMGAAAASGFFVILFLLAGIACLLTEAAGLRAYWSCFIVALGVALIAAGLFVKGRASLDKSVTPDKAIKNVNRDIKTAKEQLT
jgi:hypothetical protein